MAKQMIVSYMVLVGCENAAGKRFEPGSTCTSKDFPVEVIDAWVEQGILAPGTLADKPKVEEA